MANLRPLSLKQAFHVGIAAVVGLSLWSGTGRATASCGDYLIRLGQPTMGQPIHGQSIQGQSIQGQSAIGHADHPMAGGEGNASYGKQNNAPCSGPNCGQAPPDDLAMRVIAVSSRDHQPVTLLLGILETVELPQVHDWDVICLDAKEFLENGGLFRPPRLIAQ